MCVCVFIFLSATPVKMYSFILIGQKLVSFCITAALAVIVAKRQITALALIMCYHFYSTRLHQDLYRYLHNHVRYMCV